MRPAAPPAYLGLVLASFAMACGGEAVTLAPFDSGVTDASPSPSADAGLASGADAAATACTFEGTRAHATHDPPPTHVNDISGYVYPSNPPASGPHCGAWGAYAIYPATAPLPRCHFIHNLEHGAVVLLYNCPTGCPAIVDALTQIRTAVGADPDCAKPRVILTPDPLLDVQVAAAAWGFTWKSNCLDPAARADLLTFASGHLGSRGQAPEPFVCSDGSVKP